MNFSVKTTSIEQCKSHCVVIGVYANEKSKKANSLALTIKDDAQEFEKSCRVSLATLFDHENFSGQVGQTLVVHQINEHINKAILVGLGEKDKLTAAKYRSSTASYSRVLAKNAVKNADIFLDNIEIESLNQGQQAQYCAEKLTHAYYRFTQCKSHQKKPINPKINFHLEKGVPSTSVKQALATGVAVGKGMNVARELGNLPGNICTPTYLANEAKKLARSHKTLTAKILSEKQMADLGMGSLLSVSAGSKEPAQLIIMEYKGAAKSQRPHVLVGKGITFDTGGISLKPGGGMDEMKFDMCGAASVFGTMNTIVDLAPKINVVAIVAAAENMPSSTATKPGDIVTSMSGKTIEVLNTDAEGRLVLCDALSYAERYKPQSVVDIATLTGACVVALGGHATGLFSNNEQLTQDLLKAGNDTGDRAWQMPLWDDYKKQLKSNFADLANIGGREAGSITAACFLSHFTESYPWAHLDIAGTAWLSGANKGATGRPVPLLTQYLLAKADK
ncbi:Cytosol aminopeptidase PepA [gamma proteobacterium IMCC1989]|nr:Cytosol aminopeptidase PepA [gamma proteobacterium IMCC1989]